MQILTLRCLSVSFASVLGSLEGALSHFAPIMNRDLARVALLAVAVALPTMAQEANLEMGYKPYGTYHGSDIETVSVTNGNLSVRIPLVSYPQRGDLQLNFGLAWDNLGFSAEVVCDPFGNNCKNLWDQCGSPVGGGCIGVFSYDDHDLRVSRQQLFCLLPSCSRGDSIFIYVARNGDNREQEMVDLGGGILRSTNAAGLYGSYVVHGTSTLIDRSGIRYSSYYNPSGSAVIREDRNGNQILKNFSTGAITDTIGRSIPAPSSTSDFSGCTGPLPIGSATVVNYPGPNGGTAPIKFCYATITIQTNFPNSYGQYTANTSMLQSAVLANGTAWTFEYSDRDPGDPPSVNYGDITKITFPTGGTISYTWTSSNCSNSGTSKRRGVTSRTLDTNDGTGPHTWTYSSTVTDPIGNDTLYTFVGSWCSKYVATTQYWQGSQGTGTLLKTVSTTYSSTPDPIQEYKSMSSLVNVVPAQITTTWPGGKVSQIQIDHNDPGFNDPYGAHYIYGNVTAERKYDYGSGQRGALLKQTLTSYLAFSNSNYLTNNLLNLVSSKTLKDGGGTQQAQTTYGYDGSQLVASGISTQHNATPPDGTYRGNQTSISQWLNTNNSNVTSTATFYDTGMMQQTKDPLLNPKTYVYSSSFAGAYVTQECNALSQCTSYDYDFNTGLLTTRTDPNQQPTTYGYDLVSRLTGMTNPDGGGTTVTYNDIAVPPNAVVSAKITSSMNKVSTVVVDALGRLTQTQLTSDPEGVDYAETAYDANGRMASKSNPHRSAGNDTDGNSTYVIDALGRTTTLTKQDGSRVITSYNDNCTTVTDEASNSRKSCLDGLGRLVTVTEDPSGLGYVTNYSFDALDNLTCVEQHGNVTGTGCSANPSNDATSPWRVRRFTYDSLSRLLTAANPESGTISYAYDTNGNVLTKTAPLPNVSSGTVTTTYHYDALDRLTGKTYTGMTMPSLLYGYDGVAPTGCSPPSLTDSYPVGRRTSMCDGSGATSWSHDKMGRMLSQKQTQAISGGTNVTKTASYDYNLDGSLKTLTYPSGNVMTYAVGGAGRATQVSDSSNNYVGYSGNYATYTPTGALAAMTNGHTGSFAGIVTTNSYNNRLQPAVLSAASPAQTLFSLSYGFNPGHDNGKVQQIVNNLDSSRSATFTYDPLNRISQANTTTTTGANCWGEAYTIDAWGNLTNIAGVPSMTGCNTESQNVPVSVNNRVTGWCYDGAGNLLDMGACAPQAHSFVYDAEGHLQSPPAVGAGTATLTYTYYYDGDGNRVQKCNANPCTSGSTAGTLYWLGAGGEVLNESSRSGSMQEEYVYFNGQRIARRDLPSGNVHYYFSNHLGSPSVITDSIGNVQQQTDYYPYGGIAYNRGLLPNSLLTHRET